MVRPLSKSKILSTGVGYEGIFYSPKKRIPQLSSCRERENKCSYIHTRITET